VEREADANAGTLAWNNAHPVILESRRLMVDRANRYNCTLSESTEFDSFEAVAWSDRRLSKVVYLSDPTKKTSLLTNLRKIECSVDATESPVLLLCIGSDATISFEETTNIKQVHISKDDSERTRKIGKKRGLRNEKPATSAIDSKETSSGSVMKHVGDDLNQEPDRILREDDIAGTYQENTVMQLKSNSNMNSANGPKKSRGLSIAMAHGNMITISGGRANVRYSV
jgi:hypothetical protein